ncbi:hypothetical protein [Pseudooceanicola algae]|uniref:Uncharacterized protein n=1 Tax=Pseudooceanicola algae TaxID=1537215 RepID=A0A418SIT3_9RHOB|nr:hypothetical protein [Pseudooceanicola algae]QPM91962.1 hypothetical protein PSAL_032250 [Pseudooceanicola algae]
MLGPSQSLFPSGGAHLHLPDHLTRIAAGFAESHVFDRDPLRRRRPCAALDAGTGIPFFLSRPDVHIAPGLAPPPNDAARVNAVADELNLQLI